MLLVQCFLMLCLSVYGSDVELYKEGDFHNRRKGISYNHLSKTQIENISVQNKVNQYDSRTDKNFSLVTNKVTRLGEKIEVAKISGNVQIQKAGFQRVSLQKSHKIADYDKFFTLEKSSCIIYINDNVSLEFGKNSAWYFTQTQSSKDILPYLVKGKVRIKVKKGNVKIHTMNTQLLVPEGYADIIISGMNTLAALRESSSSLNVSAAQGRRSIREGAYALVSNRGAIIVSSGKSDKGKTKKQNGTLRKIRDSFKDVFKPTKFSTLKLGGDS